ncbi:MAG: hypothetical protein ACK2U9_01855 [Anaerolineae bacterium]
MCSEKGNEGPTTTEALENLRKPMPLARKIKLIARNNWIKLRTQSDCCGNYGEPGC